MAGTARCPSFLLPFGSFSEVTVIEVPLRSRVDEKTRKMIEEEVTVIEVPLDKAKTVALSTPFWEFQGCCHLPRLLRAIRAFLLPFGSFKLSRSTRIGLAELTSFSKLSTPFWEFLERRIS